MTDRIHFFKGSALDLLIDQPKEEVGSGIPCSVRVARNSKFTDVTARLSRNDLDAKKVFGY